MNSTQKDGLSALISKGGFQAYGRFWAFMELFYSMQINRPEFSSTIKINEKTILKQLQMNCRSLPKLLQLFSETLSIVFEKNCETFGIVYKVTAPNSLIYIKKRNKKTDNIDINKERDIKININNNNNKIKIETIDRIFNLYPTQDINNKNRIIQKTSKDKYKIKKIIKTHYPLYKSIKYYLYSCYKNKIYLKNLSVFLNNLPEVDLVDKIKLSDLKRNDEEYI